MFQGVMTALVTPFKDTEVDIESLRSLVERQIKNGVSGLVACGTTGEAAAMTMEENLLVIRQVVEQASGRVPVVAGTGSNNFRNTMEMTRKAASLKVDGVLVVTPYYIKPTQSGLLDYFGQVAEVGPPIVAYNVPGRTGVSLTAKTVSKLAKIKNVVALKEATGNMQLGAQMIRDAAGGLCVLSGDDFTYLPLLAVGGQGCISVTSNVAPAQMVEMTKRFWAGDIKAATEIHQKLLPLMEALFLESNPIPVKAAMSKLGLCGPEIRKPLGELADQFRPQLDAALKDCGITEGN